MKRVGRYLALTLVLVGVSACAGSGPSVYLRSGLSGLYEGTAESYFLYIEGYRKELAGKLDEAEKFFSRAVEKDPNSPFVLTRYASVLIRQGKLKPAEKTTSNPTIVVA